MFEVFKMSDKEINYSLFGLLLGDGWIQNRTNQNKKMLGIQHSAKQEEYMRWLEDLGKYWGIFRRSYYNRKKIATYGPFEFCEMHLTLPDERHFLKFNRFFDDSGRKIISKYVMKRITPLGLLFWFLDDGALSISHRSSEAANTEPGAYRVTRQAMLSTYSFDRKSHETAQKYLLERFGINAKIHQWNPKCKGKHYLKLYFSATDFRKLFDVVRPYLPYIPESMYYKFDMKYQPSRKARFYGNNDQLYTMYNMPIARDILHEDSEIVHSLQKCGELSVRSNTDCWE